MLTDGEWVALSSDGEFKKLTHVGVNQFVRDFVRSGDVEFKTDPGTIRKTARYFLRGRIIRKELIASSTKLIEQMLNHELTLMPRPEDVENICESDHTAFEWMRFEKNPVRALFSYSRGLLHDSRVRVVIKRHSSLESAEANGRFVEIRRQLDELDEWTLDFLDLRSGESALTNIRKRQWYRENQKRAIEEIRKSGPGLVTGQSGAPIAPSDPRKLPGAQARYDVPEEPEQLEQDDGSANPQAGSST